MKAGITYIPIHTQEQLDNTNRDTLDIRFDMPVFKNNRWARFAHTINNNIVYDNYHDIDNVVINCHITVAVFRNCENITIESSNKALIDFVDCTNITVNTNPNSIIIYSKNCKNITVDNTKNIY